MTNFTLFSQKTILLFILLLCHSGLSAAADKNAMQAQTIWQQGDQFVKLVPRESTSNKTTDHANLHPAIIPTEQLSDTIAKIRVLSEKTLFTKERGNALLQKNVADTLALQLSQGLKTANPNQDIVFAINTLINSAGIGKEKVSVAGRAFYLNDRLHVIIGDLFKPTTPKEFYTQKSRPTKIDRRMHPHQPGSRDKITEHTDHRISRDGVKFYNNRTDWLILSFTKLKTTIEAVAVEEAVTEEKEAAHSESTQLQSSGSNIEERLSKLKNLFDKGLITKEEYTATKKRILKEI
jgi:Short C-terminal domain